VKGIRYLIDERGEKSDAVIDIKRYKYLWEDFQDAVTAKLREKEPKVSIDDVEKRLKAQGRLVE